jgi:hypothetical protein
MTERYIGPPQEPVFRGSKTPKIDISQFLRADERTWKDRVKSRITRPRRPESCPEALNMPQFPISNFFVDFFRIFEKFQ